MGVTRIGYSGFYRNIYYVRGKYRVQKDGVSYGEYDKVEDALYERDRLIGCDWNIDKWCELPDTMNGYIHIDLPPFTHKPKNIYKVGENWEVLSKGRNPRYYGNYHSEEEAKKICRIYDGRIIHHRPHYRVEKQLNGKRRTYGNYDTLEEAEKRVEELNMNGWKK